MLGLLTLLLLPA